MKLRSGDLVNRALGTFSFLYFHLLLASRVVRPASLFVFFSLLLLLLFEPAVGGFFLFLYFHLLLAAFFFFCIFTCCWRRASIDLPLFSMCCVQKTPDPPSSRNFRSPRSYLFRVFFGFFWREKNARPALLSQLSQPPLIPA